MERLFTYVSETGAMPLLGPSRRLPHEFNSPGDIFRTTLEHEYHITKCINGLAHVAFTTQDYFHLQLPAVVCGRAARRRRSCSRASSIVCRWWARMARASTSSTKELAELAKGRSRQYHGRRCLIVVDTPSVQPVQ